MAADYNFKTEDSREFYTQTSASQITGDIFVTSEGTTIQAGAAVVGPISYPSITAPTNPSINYPNYTQPGVPSVESMALPGTTTTNSNGTVTISNSSSQSSSSVYEDDLFPDIWFNDTTVSYNHFTLPDKVLNLSLIHIWLISRCMADTKKLEQQLEELRLLDPMEFEEYKKAAMAASMLAETMTIKVRGLVAESTFCSKEGYYQDIALTQGITITSEHGWIKIVMPFLLPSKRTGKYNCDFLILSLIHI